MSNSQDLMVEVSKLTVKFDGFTAVNNISFSVVKGEIFGFLGANGAGKTTTIRVLCGLLHPTQGKVRVGGIPFLSHQDEIHIKKIVGYMSQQFTLYNDLTIEENLDFTASLRGLNKKTYQQRRKFVLDLIQFDRPLDSFVRDIPPGVKQQISLAASILHDPQILFLDEPTAGVTPAIRLHFWSIIRTLAKLNKTIFVTTHHIAEAEECDRIAFMRSGEIVALNTPEFLKKNTFKAEVFELEPKENIPYSNIRALSKDPNIDFFEPYGIRYHVAFKNTRTSEELKKSLMDQFVINKIEPTLEDVFIRTVEGSKKMDTRADLDEL